MPRTNILPSENLRSTIFLSLGLTAHILIVLAAYWPPYKALHRTIFIHMFGMQLMQPQIGELDFSRRQCKTYIVHCNCLPKDYRLVCYSTHVVYLRLAFVRRGLTCLVFSHGLFVHWWLARLHMNGQ
ncbi:hypothetical protein BKA66DRAFT_15324 [Pyrenochaeta sp. MPI-SDFR-AT-0127]|nr:hypothetical protein BKA66DRAFT_15324 [Pyrenochaeta sp. MPI-SDFR-AT-0127]